MAGTPVHIVQGALLLMLFLAVVLVSPQLLPSAAFEAVTVSDLAMIQDGITLQRAEVGRSVLFQSSLNNNMQSEQPFVYIIQIDDLNDYTVFLSVTSGALQGVQALSTAWTPENEGRHTVQVFVWQNLAAPTPLSTKVEYGIDVTAFRCAGSASCFIGTLTWVVDGDTIGVDDVTVRLALVNTPERGQEGYAEATAFTAGLCLVGSTAQVDEDDWQTAGSYGRMVAKVFCGGQNLNEELLRAGHATIYEQYCKVSEFGKEAWAREYGC